MAAKFVVKKGTTDKFHFTLVAANGEIVATSQSYTSKEGALKGIEAVRHAAPSARVDDETDK
ncbi:MAG: YegP family protein [Mycobacteriales bacterium]